MTAIYNEIEPYAAQWLRNLIAAGHIASGVVDDRSITELTPARVSGHGQRHFFAGIGVWSAALRDAGVPDDADVWTGSCPCQPFSVAGRRRGDADVRHLWPIWRPLIAECRPPIIFGEQVASGDGRNWLAAVRADLEALGYVVGAADLCAAGVGAPHIRQRLFFVAYANGVNGRLHVPRREPGGANAQALRHGETGDVADPTSIRLDGNRHAGLRRRQLADDRGDGALADAQEERRGSGRLGSAHGRAALESDRRGATGELGDASSTRGRRHAGADDREEAQSASARIDAGGISDESGTSSPACFWDTCEWIPCDDGKSRPTEPGTFPLAHGALARVGRVRAYGNAVVRQATATFIRAAFAAIKETS